MTGMTQATSSLSFRSSASAALLLAALTGCTGQVMSNDGGDDGPGPGPVVGDGIAISLPAHGSVVRRTRVEVQGTTDLADGATVRVNDVEAPVMGGQFTAMVELAEGPAQIEAFAGAERAAVEIVVDATPPLIVLEPEEERMFQEGTTFTVRGHVEDATAVTLTADDEEIAVAPDGSFELARTVEPGSHRVRLVAQDEAGHLGAAYAAAMVGRFRAHDSTLQNAMALEIGQDALDALSTGISAELAAVDVESQLMAQNPVVNEWWGTVDVTAESHGRIEASLGTGSDHLRPGVVVHDVRVDFIVRGKWGGSSSGYLYAERAVLESTAHVSAVDGAPEVALSGVSVRLEGFRFEMSGVPSWVENWEAARDRIRRTTENAIRDAISRELPPYIERALSQIRRGGTVEVGGRSIYIGVDLADLGADDHGIWAAVDLTPSARSEGSPPGSLYTGATAPPYQNGSSIDVAVSLDAVNAALHEAWLRGVLDQTVAGPSIGDEPLTVNYLSLLLPALRGLAPGDAPVDFNIAPALPPAVVETPDGLKVMASDVRVEAVARVEGEDPVSLLTLSLGAQASAYARVSDGELGVRLSSIELSADLVEGPEALPAGEELEELLLSVVGDRVEESMEIGGFRVPSLYGFSLSAYGAEIQDGYLSLGGRLRYAP